MKRSAKLVRTHLSRRQRARQKSVAILPSMLTLGNLLCGFTAVFLASRPITTDLPWGWSPLTCAGVFVFLGMLFDAFDGSVARLTHNTSELGAQLDSMADMVTFGVAPAIIVIHLIGVDAPFLSERGDAYLDRIAMIVAGIYVCCVALRLARFNIEIDEPEESDHLTFKGLPSPGAAGTVVSLILLHQYFFSQLNPNLWAIRATAVMMVGIMLLVALAMVSNLRYPHFINKYFRGRANFGKFALMLMLIMLLFVAPQHSVAGGFVVYALFTPIGWLLGKIKRKDNTQTPVEEETDTPQAQS
ncbi:MAG: CDP-diacylglycerol--serine O-phosphatidyltransferase [Phycisphaeraceae bacterium]|nr:CDP-diacylglycerol--serine O-phosphatidyltransferase [Phycisphaeraceae bacterium]